MPRAGQLTFLIDALNRRVGQAVAWLTLSMVVGTFAIVVLRYGLGVGPIWLQESITWMHAAVFMLGGAYTLQRDEHVRVDIFYRGASARRQAWVDAIGVLVFLLPLCVFIIVESFDYVAASWLARESSRDFGGLPYPFIPLLKSTLLLMPVLLGLQGLALLWRCVRRIRGEPAASEAG